MFGSLHVSAQQDSTGRDTTRRDTVLNDTTKTFTDSTNVVGTEDRLVLTDVIADSTQTRQLFIKGVRINNKRLLVFTLQTGTADVIEVAAGNKIGLTTTDGSKVSIYNDMPVRSEFRATNYGCVVTVNCPLTSEDELWLINYKVTRVTMEYQGGVFTLDIDAGQAGVLQEVLLAIR
jgi:hypothetical protein